MGERLQRGPKLRNICETGVGTRKGKHTGASRELPRLAAAVRTTRKRVGSHRVRREASDRVSKPIRKEPGRSTNDNLTHRVTASRRTSVEGPKKRPPGRAGAEAYLQLSPRKGEATMKALNHPKRDLENSSFRSRNRSKRVSTQRVTTSRRISLEGKEKQTKPSFRSRIYQPRPHLVTPSRRLRTLWVKRTHRNLHIQSKLEREGQERRQRTPWPKKRRAHNHRTGGQQTQDS